VRVSVTIREALAEGTAALTTEPDMSGLTSPRLDASLLLAKILNMSRLSLITADSQPLTEASLAAFRGLIKRRLDGECVAYIVGKKEFYGLDFQVNPSVLVPRPDTETLVDVALDTLKEAQRQAVFIDKGSTVRAQEKAAVFGKRRDCFSKPSGRCGVSANTQPVRVLDLCTGSGAVAIALKHTMPELEIWATDISAEALATAQTNAANLLPADSIHFLQGDLFEALRKGLGTRDSGLGIEGQGMGSEVRKHKKLSKCSAYKQYSPVPIIITNPPYVPSAEIAGLAPEVRKEPLLALDGGDDGLSVIRRIISGAPQILCSGGILLLEADPRQMERIAVLLQQAGFVDIQIRKDLSGKERVIKSKYNAT